MLRLEANDFYFQAAQEGYAAQACDIIHGDIDRLLDDIRRNRIKSEKALTMMQEAEKRKITVHEKVKLFTQRLHE